MQTLLLLEMLILDGLMKLISRSAVAGDYCNMATIISIPCDVITLQIEDPGCRRDSERGCSNNQNLLKSFARR
uniref:Secreted protein n=1 Tax=Tetranychus urticae TaxID=32264 RepID=T1K8H3_TETUR